MAQPTSTPQGTPQYTTFLRALAQISVAQICEGPIGERRVAFDAVQVRVSWAVAIVHGLTDPRLCAHLFVATTDHPPRRLSSAFVADEA